MRAYEGIKIIDFTQVLAGPIGTQMFSLLGADVIKIEAPGKGDQLRTTLSDAEMVAKRLSPAFLTANLNKRSLAIDLKSEEGRDIVSRLIKDADVVVENFRPGVAKKLGIDFESVKKLNPEIVYCSVSGYGQTGPRSGDKAYDSAIQASSGLFNLNGNEETGPLRIGLVLVDMFTGVNAAFAIASALHRREKTGKGQYVDVAMYDSAMLLAAPQMADYMVRGNIPPLIGNGSPTRQATAGVFDTKDGRVLIATITPEHNLAMLKAAGLEHTLEDPRFATFEARQENAEEGKKLVAEAMKAKTTGEWVEIMSSVGVVVQEVRTLSDATSDPQLEHRGIVVTGENITGFDDALRLIGVPFIANEDSPKNVASSPGKVGEHTEEILRELGYDEAAIGKMLAAGSD